MIEEINHHTPSSNEALGKEMATWCSMEEMLALVDHNLCCIMTCSAQRGANAESNLVQISLSKVVAKADNRLTTIRPR
jgi:hypothetical protein